MEGETIEVTQLMLVYTTQISPRLSYIISFFEREIGPSKWTITTSEEVFLQEQGPKINYSRTRVAGPCLTIHPHKLILEKGIHLQDVVVDRGHGLPFIFTNKEDFPFDIFAAVFFLVTRYEEYLDHDKDIYGRYAHNNSLAFREGFLDIPLVDQWLVFFKDSLATLYPSFTPVKKGFRFLPTYDIDEAWSYRHKGWLRRWGAMARALVKRDVLSMRERIRVHSGSLPDPYDSYEWLDALHTTYHLAPRYFFLVARGTGKYDRNINPSNPALQKLIADHAMKYDIGVHPSWRSGDRPLLLKDEISRLEKITGRKVYMSRQHYIRFTLPFTFRELIAAGIREDYSMGYGSVNGFRASTSIPHYWYDLEKEETTGLLLYPFCFMDANSFFEKRLTPEQAFTELKEYYNRVVAVNGTMVTIWHNTFFGTSRLFNGWKDVYLRFVAETKQDYPE